LGPIEDTSLPKEETVSGTDIYHHVQNFTPVSITVAEISTIEQIKSYTELQQI